MSTRGRCVYMAEIANTLFNGLSLGSIYLLVALGLSVTFGLMGIINMAHGEFVMIGAYMAYVMQQILQHSLAGAEAFTTLRRFRLRLSLHFFWAASWKGRWSRDYTAGKWTVCLQHGASASYCSRLQEAYLAHRVSMSMRLIFKKRHTN